MKRGARRRTEEKDVGDSAELLEQIPRDERDQVVLARQDLIRDERPAGSRDDPGPESARFLADDFSLVVLDRAAESRQWDFGPRRERLGRDGDIDEDLARIRVPVRSREHFGEVKVGDLGESFGESILRTSARDRSRYHRCYRLCARSEPVFDRPRCDEAAAAMTATTTRAAPVFSVDREAALSGTSGTNPLPTVCPRVAYAARMRCREMLTD